jgi:hypothetical protein
MGSESEYRSQSRQDIRRAVAELAERPARLRETLKAEKVVGLWNARLARDAEPLFVPTFSAALRCNRPRLEYQCPACGMIGDADIRTFDRHPRATIQSLIPALSCPRCPDGPFVRLRGLFPY